MDKRNPFQDPEDDSDILIEAPGAAFTLDRLLPKRFHHNFLEDSSDEEESNPGGPISVILSPDAYKTRYLPVRPSGHLQDVELRLPNASPSRQSPSIFARSKMHVSQKLLALKNAPDLAFPSYDTSTTGGLSGTGSTDRTTSPSRFSPTLRKQFTDRELPLRSAKRTQLVVSDGQDSDADEENPFSGSPRRSVLLNASRSTGERFLEPPKPIFLPETFAEANSDVADDRLTLNGNMDYSYDIYQKAMDAEDDEKHLVFSEKTAYSGARSTSSGSSSAGESVPGTNSDFFGASIDGNIMQNVDNYVPNTTRPVAQARKVRLVGLKSGNMVLENPISDELKKVLTRTESPFGEFTNMTYTACTSHPDDFAKEGYSLRAAKYGRETELVICITMYNEDGFLFARTMHAVMKNVAHLCSRHKSSVWGKESWKKVQVIIVSDGRNKINQEVLDLLTATGCYQDNLARPYVNNQSVKAHLFEYTTQISIDENLKFKGDEKALAPVQVLFCLKERNQKKINSHRWLFNAFCPVLDPNVIILLDVGTKPDNHTIYNLWKAFDRDLNVAGAAGEIKAMKGRGWKNLLNPLVASQNFEYKMSNILDKPLESLFGYITVLPGALSAYRYIALKNHEDGTGPLDAYFKGEDLLASDDHKKKNNSKSNFFEANMYLAEDRVLCWELVAKKGENWVLKFVKNATGETDVPESVPEFLLQRRRWINGAFFAALYSLKNSSKIWFTDHLMMRKFWFQVEFAYQMLSLVFSFFSLSNFYLTFYFLTGSLINNKHLGKGGFWIFTIFNYLCICTLTSLFIVSIGNRPQASQRLFKILILLLTICALYSLIVGFYFVVNTLIDFDSGSSNYVMISIVVSLLLTYGLYTLMSFLYMDPWHMFTCLIQYFLMIPSYTCTLQIFAFCNTHDVSWGTKGDTDNKEDKSNRYVIEKGANGEFEAVITEVNVDETYLETLYNIRARRLARKVKSSSAPRAQMEGEDYAKDVRSKVVLTWMLCNLVFVLTMMQVYSAGETKSNKYLAFILWSVAVMSLFRGIGSLGYLSEQGLRFTIETYSKWAHRRQGYKLSKTVPLN